MIFAYSGYAMTEDCDNKLEIQNSTNTEQTDSLTITVYVSFTVSENGQIGQPKIEKTECSEYDIKELDKKAIKNVEKKALQVIEEMDDLDPIEKPTKYTQPIKMRLPADKFLKSK